MAPPLQRRRSVAGGGSGSPGSTYSPGTPYPGAQQRSGTSSPGYVSFQRLLAANRPQAEAMAGRVLGQVEAQGQQAQQAVQGAQQQHQQKVAAGTLAFDPTRATTSQQAQQLAGTAYSAPRTLEEAGVDTGALWRQVGQASGQAQQLGSEGGRAAILRGMAGPGYTAGQAGMDSALLGAAGGRRLADTSSAYSRLAAILGQAQGGAGAAWEAGRGASDAARKQYAGLGNTLARQEEEARVAEDLAQVGPDPFREYPPTYYPGAPEGPYYPKPRRTGGR